VLVYPAMQKPGGHKPPGHEFWQHRIAPVLCLNYRQLSPYFAWYTAPRAVAV
jgi:hypothetical protein